jgi:transcriptional regulator of heat shock response
MLEKRKELILRTIVKEFIQTGQAVSSGLIASKYKLDISPATIRNEMMELEDSGYIYQPHTSAGRVPTEQAYQLEIEYLSNKLPELKKTEREKLENFFKQDKNDLRVLAKLVADLVNNTVFWAFHKNSLYYTGLSNLFSQTEFRQSEAVYDVSLVIDRMEEIIDQEFDNLDSGLQFKLGSSNPFGPFLGTVMLKYKKNRQSGLCGILGPMRMDYAKNGAILNFLNNKLS